MIRINIFCIEFCVSIFIYLFYWLISEREGWEQGDSGGGGERERNVDALFCLFMHSLVDSCMCPDQRQNPKPWCIGATL